MQREELWQDRREERGMMRWGGWGEKDEGEESGERCVWMDGGRRVESRVDPREHEISLRGEKSSEGEGERAEVRLWCCRGGEQVQEVRNHVREVVLRFEFSRDSSEYSRDTFGFLARVSVLSTVAPLIFA